MKREGMNAFGSRQSFSCRCNSHGAIRITSFFLTGRPATVSGAAAARAIKNAGGYSPKNRPQHPSMNAMWPRGVYRSNDEICHRHADVPSTPAMMTGTVTGYNRIGSNTSRVRDLINTTDSAKRNLGNLQKSSLDLLP